MRSPRRLLACRAAACGSVKMVRRQTISSDRPAERPADRARHEQRCGKDQRLSGICSPQRRPVPVVIVRNSSRCSANWLCMTTCPITASLLTTKVSAKGGSPKWRCASGIGCRGLSRCQTGRADVRCILSGTGMAKLVDRQRHAPSWDILVEHSSPSVRAATESIGHMTMRSAAASPHLWKYDHAASLISSHLKTIALLNKRLEV